MKNQTDIVIIGAGLTGLTMAFYLKKAGKRVVVVEKASHFGGAIRTFRKNGYIFDSGPNTGTLSTIEIVELFESLKGCTLETANKHSHRRLIYKNGKLHALPSGPLSGFFTPLFSWKDKFGILLEPFRKKGTDPDESIASLAARRLGKSCLDYAVDPFISGIYAGDPNTLITRYAIPKLYALEASYGSFIRGAIAKAKEPKSKKERKVSKEVFSLEGGLDHLISALVEAIGKQNIILEASPEISGDANSWQVKLSDLEIITPVVVSTVGSYALPSLFPFAPESIMSKVNNLRYAAVVQASVIVSSSSLDGNDLRAFGTLIPSKEKRHILGILYPSSCFRDRCPEGKSLLSVFLGGIRFPEMIHLPDDEIEELIKNELRIVFRKPKLEPEQIQIFRHPYAIPQYEKNTGERLKAIQEFERIYPGIILAGNLRDGIGMAYRIKQATDIAHSL